MHKSFFLVLRAVLLLGFLAPWQANAWAGGKRDLLLQIVEQCVDSRTLNYCHTCAKPRADAACGTSTACRDTTEVWALNRDFVALRDVKMCGCDKPNFVHGLALPRSRVRGVEDPLRPDAIWQFAWDEGTRHINAQELALVVNPPHQRSQDQLHVHLVRLQETARARLRQEPGAQIGALDLVWSTAAALAHAHGIERYGVLVMADEDVRGKFRLVISADSPEDAYTQARCSTAARTSKPASAP